MAGDNGAAPMLSVVIPAHNEAQLIASCLGALFASAPAGVATEVIVVANGCTDNTADVARAMVGEARARGWPLVVVDRTEGGKPGALNAGDAVARGGARLYLDADVKLAPDFLAKLWPALETPTPIYVSGRIRITGQSRVSRRYARAWARVPFMARGVPGCGAFAVNAAGRARWGGFPEIISDDTFVRLNFAPEERRLIDAHFDWPVAEGRAALIRTRKRQDQGVDEIARLYPELMQNDDKLPLSLPKLAGLMLSDPLAWLTYLDIRRAVARAPAAETWSRGR